MWGSGGRNTAFPTYFGICLHVFEATPPQHPVGRQPRQQHWHTRNGAEGATDKAHRRGTDKCTDGHPNMWVAVWVSARAFVNMV